jgi:hypothetical protein
VITGKNIRISLSYLSFFILLSCSKSDNPTKNPSPNLNAYTYTFTDTTGIDHTYADTAMFNPDSNKYYVDGGTIPYTAIASISPPDTGNNKLLQFRFYNHKTRNALAFSLPYFRAGLSGTNNFLKAPIILEWEREFYDVAPPQPPGLSFGTVYLANFTTSTNISDSAGGYVTGSFNISATTVDSGKIKISGQFSRLPTNYTP